MTTLGCPPISVAFFRRGTTSLAAPGINEGFISTSWSRAVDATSDATVVLPAGLCRLDEIHPLVHDLGIIRGDQLVWVGPLYDMEEKDSQVTILGRDVTWWWNVRKLRTARLASDEKIDACVLFERLVIEAMELDNSPGVSVNRVTAGQRVARDIRAGDFANSALSELAQTVVDYSAILREIRVWGTAIGNAPIAHLTNEICAGTPSIRRSGENRASEWTGIGAAIGYDDETNEQTDVRATVSSPEAKARFGLIQRDVTEATITDVASVRQLAQTNMDRSNTDQPSALSVPLAPHAPLSVDQIIPGAMVSVDLEGATLRATGSLRIASFTETTGPDGTSATLELSVPGTAA